MSDLDKIIQLIKSEDSDNILIAELLLINIFGEQDGYFITEKNILPIKNPTMRKDGHVGAWNNWNMTVTGYVFQFYIDSDMLIPTFVSILYKSKLYPKTLMELEKPNLFTHGNNRLLNGTKHVSRY